MVYGGNLQGDAGGLYAESVRADTGRSSTVEGLGVCGVGDNFGILGMTFPSTAAAIRVVTCGGTWETWIY
jgi:hypothetical protein